MPEEELKKARTAWANTMKSKKKDDADTIILKKMLRKLKQDDVDQFLTNIYGLHRKGKPHISNTSGCSGSEGFMIVGMAFAELVTNMFKDDTAFRWLSNGSAEFDAPKQQFIVGPIHQAIRERGGVTEQDLPCCFSNYAEMSHSKGHCVVHGPKLQSTGGKAPSVTDADRSCRVKSADVHWAGISCKTMSRLFKEWGRLAPSALREKSGSSGDTFLHLLNYLDAEKPLIYVGENVDDITKPDNLDSLLEEFGRRGYAMRGMSLKSSDYSSPQKRVRYYFICINIAKSGLSEQEVFDILKNIFATIAALTVPMTELADHRLPESHRYRARAARARVALAVGASVLLED